MDQPSKFAEVREKSKSKRAQLDQTTAARQAKRASVEAGEHMERSVKYGGDFQRPGLEAQKSATPTVPSRITEHDDIDDIDDIDADETEHLATAQSNLGVETYNDLFAAPLAKLDASSDIDEEHGDPLNDPFWESIRQIFDPK